MFVLWINENLQRIVITKKANALNVHGVNDSFAMTICPQI